LKINPFISIGACGGTGMGIRARFIELTYGFTTRIQLEMMLTDREKDLPGRESIYCMMQVGWKINPFISIGAREVTGTNIRRCHLIACGF
jgi:hypothetical protein